jgi:hypothetical protein
VTLTITNTVAYHNAVKSYLHGPGEELGFGENSYHLAGDVTFSITTLSIMTLSIMSLSLMTLCIMTLSIKTISITKHNSPQHTHT